MHWTFDYPWGPTLTWLAVVGVVAVLAGSFALVWRELLPIRASTVLVVLLRLGALALIVWLLLEPSVILKKTGEIPPHVALLVDTSGSMATVDQGHERPRLREAMDALKDSRLIEELGERSKLSVFEFATGISKVKMDSLHRLEKATGTGTSFGLSLSQVSDEFRGEDLAGLIVFSDGRDNTGSDPVKAAKELDAPVFTIGFGRPKPKEEKEKERDLAIVSVSHDKRVVVGHTTDVTVTVASKGFGARSVPVELVLDGQVVARAALALSPDRPERQVTMKVKPNVPGQYVYTVRVPTDPAEGNKANNERPMPVFVTDPVARVLYVEARPRWEFKFVTRLLRAYKNVEYTAIVRTAPGKMSIQGTNAVESARIAQMTPTQLRRLKVIIIGDVPHTFFTPLQLSTIAALVDEGASVMLLAGRESFGPKGFGGTPLAHVLPAALMRRPTYVERRLRVELTEEGRAHPALQNVAHDWSKAPELISLVGVGAIRPGATVLMRTRGGSNLPVAVVHRYGKGKAALVLSDSTWRWRLGMADGSIKVDLQTILWRQLITWLMPEEQAEKERRAVQLVANKLHYELGEQVSLTVAAVDAEGKAVRDAKVVCHITMPDGKLMERQASLGKLEAGGEARAEGYVTSFVPHMSGKYTVVATAQADGADLGRDQVSIRVGETSIEMNETDPNRELLKKLALLSGGGYYEPRDASQIASRIAIKPKKNTWTEKKEVWDRWWVFLCFVGLVGAEWVIRRTRQLE